MMQEDIQTNLDTRTSVAGGGSEPSPEKTRVQSVLTSPLGIAGALTAAVLLRKQLFRPSTLLLAGGAYAYWRVKGGQLSPSQGLVKEQATFTINKPAEELYNLWHDVQQSPKWMEGIRSVTDLGNGRSHWVLDLPNNLAYQWDAEWTAEEPGKRLAWHTVGEGMAPAAGQITFEPAVNGRGTVVRVNQEFLLPGGKLSAALSGLFSRTPGGFVRENLRHFKQLAEAGEIATTKGQPAGKRGLLTSIPQALTGDREQQRTDPSTGTIAHGEVA